jgi:hypothetical protein
MRSDWQRDFAAQAAVRGDPSERASRSDGRPADVKRATVTTAGRIACLVRSDRPRSAWSRIRAAGRRGSGALPFSSQRWHQTTSPTARDMSTTATHGCDSQSAPDSSTNMSLPPTHRNAGYSLCVPVTLLYRGDQEFTTCAWSAVASRSQPACQAWSLTIGATRPLYPNV